MTSDEMVEAMARALFEAHGEREWSWKEVASAPVGSYAHGIAVGLRTEARAAIRACHDAGGLVLREVPERKDARHDASSQVIWWNHGRNYALTEVRAVAVEGV